jgi:hypothetical protein
VHVHGGMLVLFCVSLECEVKDQVVVSLIVVLVELTFK